MNVYEIQKILLDIKTHLSLQAQKDNELIKYVDNILKKLKPKVCKLLEKSK